MSRKLLPTASICVLTLSWLLSTGAFAQSEIGSATLNGTVTDPAAAPIPGAKVTATNTATGFVRSTETSTAGLYSFSGLPVGAYDITVEAKGFGTAKLTGVSLAVGAVATLDVPMKIGAAQESVSVTADVALVETTRSQTASVVNERAVADLPLNGRNFLDLTVLTPGVVRDPTRSGDLSFGGQRGTSNSLLVDGTDANNVFFGQTTGRAGTGRNPYSFSQDAVLEFQVNSNSYAPEIGRAGGGVMNVITKSGTNDFHGTVFEFFRDKALNANTWQRNRSNLKKAPYHYNQFGGNVGGPIKKNKLFFFFDYDGQRNNSPNTVFLSVLPTASDTLGQSVLPGLQKYITTYAQGLKNDVYLGKADWNISDNQRLSVRYNANRFQGIDFENGGSSSAAEHTGNSNVTTDNIGASHSWVLGARSILETRFTFTRDNEPGQANSTSPETIIRQSGTTVLQFGRNSFSPRYTNAKTYQWAEALSLVRGTHSLKFGLDTDFQKIGNFFPGNFSGSYTFNSYDDYANANPFSFTQAFAGPGTAGPLSQPNVNEYAFYAQDSWRVNERLTLNYGVRYDLFSYAQPSVRNPDPSLTALGLDTSRINPDHNNFAPRFGFAYKLDQSGKTAIRGGYGIYYGRTPTILTGTAFTQNGVQVQTFTINSGFPTYPNVFTTPPPASRIPDIFVFAKDYVQPLTQQWSFNVERQLGKDYALTIGYLGVRGEHLTRTRDINWFPETALQGSIANGPAVTYYRHLGGRPYTAFGRISVFDSGADSIYHGVFAQLQKRFAQNFQMSAVYTFAHAIDDAPDFTSVVVGTDDVKDAQDTLQPNNERGRANADIRQRFVLSGVWDINYAKSLKSRAARAILSGYQLSLINTLQTGSPFSATVGGNDLNADGNTRTDRPPGVGRNTIGGPNFANVDARFSRAVPITERVHLTLIFEGFNITNRANFSAITTGQYNFVAATGVFTPTTNFLARTNTFDPRILQLAAKITF